MNNFRFGLKSLRYAYGIKTNLILLLVFLITGIAGTFLGIGTSMDLYANYMLMCTAMIPAQLIFSLSASNMVQASPFRKRLQTSIPAVLTCGNMMVVYLIMAGYRLVRVWGDPSLAGAMSGELAIIAGIMTLIMIYVGIAYKYFFVSIFFIAFMVLIMPHGRQEESAALCMRLFGQGINGLALTALAGAGIVALGGLLQYLVSLLVYRVPIAKMAQAAPLRREL